MFRPPFSSSPSPSSFSSSSSSSPSQRFTPESFADFERQTTAAVEHNTLEDWLTNEARQTVHRTLDLSPPWFDPAFSQWKRRLMRLALLHPSNDALKSILRRIDDWIPFDKHAGGPWFDLVFAARDIRKLLLLLHFGFDPNGTMDEGVDEPFPFMEKLLTLAVNIPPEQERMTNDLFAWVTPRLVFTEDMFARFAGTIYDAIFHNSADLDRTDVVPFHILHNTMARSPSWFAPAFAQWKDRCMMLALVGNANNPLRFVLHRLGPLFASDRDAGGKWYWTAFYKRNVSKLRGLLEFGFHPHGKLSPTSTLRFPFELYVRKLAEHDERAAVALSRMTLSFPRIEEPVGSEDEWTQQDVLLGQEVQRLQQEGPRLQQEGPRLQQEGQHLQQEGPRLQQEGPRLQQERGQLHAQRAAQEWISWENVIVSPPVQTPLSKQVSIPRDQRAYNPILLEDVDVHEWLTDPEARNENILLVVATDPRRAVQWFPITRTQVRLMAQQSTFYKCPVADSFRNVDKTNPLYSLRSLGAHGGMVSLAAIKAAHQDLTQRIWRVGSEIDHLPSVTSYAVAALNASRVSAAHCQAGQDNKKYEFTSSPWTPDRGSLGGRKQSRRGKRRVGRPYRPSTQMGKRSRTRGSRRQSGKSRPSRNGR
jgi:hypothetical protein